MNKKLVFVNLKDIATYPSKEDIPKDITDFQLNFAFLKALRASDEIVGVNIISDESDMFEWAETEDDVMTRLQVVGYFLFTYTRKASRIFYSLKNIEDAYLDASSITKKVDILKDEDSWLIVGNEELAERFGLDYISKEDFINGTARKDSLETKRGEEKKED